MRRATEATPVLPRPVFAVGLVGIAFVLVPIVGLLTGVEWGSLGPLLTSESSRAALWLSVRTATAATALCVLLGIPLATVLARARFRGRSLLRSLVLLPLVLPPVVSGMALLQAFGRRGLVGAHLSAAGIQIAFTSVAVVLAMAFVSLPFLVLTVSAALEALDPELERAAVTLGASPLRVFTTVALPSIRGALASGVVLTFARSLGEFGATLTFAGSLQGVTRTLPLEIYLQREVDPQAAVALSFLLMGLALAIVLAVHGRRR